MTHIQRLSFSRFEFSQLSSTVRSQLASLSHVTSLFCDGITFPTIQDMLAPYPNLRELELQIVALDNVATSTATEGLKFEPLASIRSLTLIIGATALDLLRSSRYIQFQTISSLTIYTEGEEYLPVIAQFLEVVGETLEHFAICIEEPDE
ncbi:hypothetical protein H0H93_007854, partial [Arthromyces matolae]